MSMLANRPTALRTGWYGPEDCNLADFRDLVEEATRLGDYPHADAVLGTTTDVVTDVAVFPGKLQLPAGHDRGQRNAHLVIG